jgi:hypothetical protein
MACRHWTPMEAGSSRVILLHRIRLLMGRKADMKGGLLYVGL